MSEKTAGSDVSQLRHEKLPQGVFPGDQAQDFRIHFAPEVHAEIWKHAVEDTSVEVCGVLVGEWKTDDRGPFVSITASIRGEAAANKLAEVTFTHETWAKINAQMDAMYRALAIVGWYHTHPDFGIFLSERDRFIHEHFFAGAGQVACVLDPIRRLEGVFRWAQGKPQLCPFYWVGAQIQQGEREEGAPRRHEPGAAAVPDAAAKATAGPAPSKVQTFASWSMMLALALGVFALGYLIAARQSGDQLRALATFALLKSARIGLRENLQALSFELRGTQALAAELAAEHQRLAKATAEEDRVRRAWEAYRTRSDAAQQALGLISEQYGLGEQETRVLVERLVESQVALEKLVEAQAASQRGKGPLQTQPPAAPAIPPDAGSLAGSDAPPPPAGRPPAKDPDASY